MRTEYKNEDGTLHRINAPAIDWPDGNGSWWYNGRIHRYYGPAWDWRRGDYEYWIFGEKIK